VKALRPHSLDEAVRQLADDPQLVLTAGCTDLMVRPPEVLHRMDQVMDLLAIPELRGIRETDGHLEIGATTTFDEIRRSSQIRATFPALADAAGQIGGWQIQNRATLGGNMANASPAGDSLPVLLALDAVVLAAGRNGLREIPYGFFHTGYRKTALEPGEIVARIRLPRPKPGTVQAFRKVGTREAQAISKVVVALAARLENGRIADLRLAAGSVAATPVRLRAAEESVRRQLPTPEAADRAGRAAADAVTPIDDVRSTADYRRFALERVVRRMVLGLQRRHNDTMG
jgi:CO/xanthine dehydrogenase FAD-binding subunit